MSERRRPNRATLIALVAAFVAALVAIVSWSGLALAAGGHGGEGEAGGTTPVPWNDMAEALVNFSIFAFLLVYFLKRPIAAFLEKRSDRIAVQLDEAARLNQEAKAKLAEYEHRIQAFDEERESLFQNVRKEADADRQQILVDAKRQAERIRKDAQVAIAFEIKRAKQELRERIVDEAVTLARRMLSERLDKATQDRLIDDYMAALSELKSDRAS